MLCGFAFWGVVATHTQTGSVRLGVLSISRGDNKVSLFNVTLSIQLAIILKNDLLNSPEPKKQPILSPREAASTMNFRSNLPSPCIRGDGCLPTCTKMFLVTEFISPLATTGAAALGSATVIWQSNKHRRSQGNQGGHRRSQEGTQVKDHNQDLY